MIKRKNSVRLSLITLLALAVTVLLMPYAAQAQDISQQAMAGKYSVTLKVLPAEAFTGADAAMVHDGGAMAEAVDGPAHPNHHMVVFIEEDGKPVEQAEVKIWYRMATDNKMDTGMAGANHAMGNNKESGTDEMNDTEKWMTLPVARMHVKGKGADTTHFGNNVMLEPGNYEVKVEVDGETAMFHFTI